MPRQGATAAQTADDLPVLTSSAPFPTHIPALDGVRGLAVFMVVIVHSSWREFVWAEGNSLYPYLAGQIYTWLMEFFWVSVDIFFALSGFLITGNLLDAKGSPHFFRNFYVRRALRIVPLYYAILVVFFFVIPHFAPLFSATNKTGDNPLWLWTFNVGTLLAVKNDYTSFSDWMRVDHFWTVSTESCAPWSVSFPGMDENPCMSPPPGDRIESPGSRPVSTRTSLRSEISTTAPAWGVCDDSRPDCGQPRWRSLDYYRRSGDLSSPRKWLATDAGQRHVHCRGVGRIGLGDRDVPIDARRRSSDLTLERERLGRNRGHRS